MANVLYTKSFNEDFDLDSCIAYDNKFKDSFRKNIKHVQQVRLLRKLMKQMACSAWLDFPAGSGRLIKDLKGIGIQEVFAFDKSKEFLAFLGTSFPDVEVHEADLFTESLEPGKYDCITCFHTLFAFSRKDQARIINNLSRGLASGGILVFDINKRKRTFQEGSRVNRLVSGNNVLKEAEIKEIVDSLGMRVMYLEYHDFVDANWPERPSLVVRCMEKLLNCCYSVRLFKRLMILLEDLAPSQLKHKIIVVASK